jgi:hypothetical protein
VIKGLRQREKQLLTEDTLQVCGEVWESVAERGRGILPHAGA